VLSDIYALGVVNCDNMLMLLGVSQKLTEHERDIVVPLLIQGFKVSESFSHITDCYWNLHYLVHLGEFIQNTVLVCFC